MKKLLALAACAVSLGAFAAFDFSGAKTIPVVPSAETVLAGGILTNDVTAVGLKGSAELFVAASAAEDRTALNVSLYTTNAVSGGWSAFALSAFTATNAGIYRLSFPAEYITAPSRVLIESTGADTSVTAFILSY